ncbi:PIN domain-containing protein [Candidatus Bipolaricaulota bacterium]|nr:PIN domain-containing protein [Candidatus Bipolaricaulota bacterium]
MHVSETTLVELLFNSNDYDLDPVRFLRDVIEIAKFDNIEDETVLAAAKFMKERNINPADSVHMAHCVNENHRFITQDLDVKDAINNISESPRCINLRSPNPQV